MQRRTTSILGAGAVLDFDFDGLTKPTTNNITKAVVELKILDFEGSETNLIKEIYDLVVDATRTEYLRLHPMVRHYEPIITFEDLFEVVETLYSYSGRWKHERFPFPLISSLVKSNLAHWPVEYFRVMLSIILKIVEIVDSYDKKFREENNEEWYKKFWNGFEGKIDVFNLNYDTTVENSLGNYIDGFVGCTPGYMRFEPEVLWNADADMPTINHLHGCIYYADPNPKPVEFYYSHRDLYKFYSVNDVKEVVNSRYWLPNNQAGIALFYSPIITGLKKTDKICYMPHSIYHAHLVRKIIENSSLLICGYSFGDLYVNQLLQRHKLVHDTNERVIIVEKWPDYVNRDILDLYRYFMDNTSPGLREYVERITEAGINPLDTFKQFKQISDGCWQSPNGVLRLYTKGAKQALGEQQEDVLLFLRETV